MCMQTDDIIQINAKSNLLRVEDFLSTKKITLLYFSSKNMAAKND